VPGPKFKPDVDTLLGLAAILLWSTTFALARRLTEQVGPLTTGAAVYLTGGILCAGYLIWKRRSAKRARQLPLRYLLGCGMLFVFYTAALLLAIGLADDRHQVLELGLLNYLWPTLTILLSLALLNKKAGLLLLPGTAAALAGVFLVLTQGGPISWAALLRNVASNPAAYVLALMAAISWALYSNLTRRWADPKSGGGVPFFIVATGLVLLALRLAFREAGSWTPRAAAEAAIMSVATVLGYVCWDIAMRKGDVVFVMACSYLTPLLSTLVSCFYLGIAPDIKLWAGCALIVAGSFASWTSISDRRRDAA